MSHDPTTDLQATLAAYREATAARRARAMVDCPDSVLGLPVRPLTPATWTLLCATESRFLQPDAQPMEGDVRNYLWFHSRLFHFSSRLPARLSRFLKWCALLRFNSMLHRRRNVHWYSATLALAAADIDRLVREAVADSPGRGEGRIGPTAPALEAQLVHIFAREYRWPPERTRATPLRQLFQLLLCLSPADDDAGERALRLDHLRRRNAELNAARAAAPSGAQPSALSAPQP